VSGRPKPTHIGEHKREEKRCREQELKDTAWADLIKNDCKVLRLDRGKESAIEIVSHLIQKRRPITLSIPRAMIDNKMTLLETEAGAELIADIKARHVERIDYENRDVEKGSTKPSDPATEEATLWLQVNADQLH
jgi:hypothetical protein